MTISLGNIVRVTLYFDESLRKSDQLTVVGVGGLR
jgi:hypothetical protein